MRTPRPPLCPECGAIRDAVAPRSGERIEATCPGCGVGYVAVSLVMTSAPGQPEKAARERLREARAERRDRSRRAVARCGFAVYGLDETWKGRRWVGGWNESGDELTAFELGYGDAFEDTAPLVRVRTEPDALGDAGMLARALAEHAWAVGGEYSDALRSTFTGDPTAAWTPLPVVVEGRVTPFRSLAGGDWWVALGRAGDAWISVQARHVDPAHVRLETVDDMDRYLADDAMPR